MKQIIRIIPTAAAAICMTCVSAFAVGEDNPGRWLYDSLPPAWEWTPETTQISPDKDIWWHQFGDETLITLLRRAVEHNYNARTALRRIDIARQAERQTKAGYWPTFDASAGWQTARDAGAAVGSHSHAERSRYFSLGVEMNWQIDVFGRGQGLFPVAPRTGGNGSRPLQHQDPAGTSRSGRNTL